jgi:hypothetical protein
MTNELLTVGMIGMIMILLASMLAERNWVPSLADETNAVERRCLMAPPKQRAAATAEVDVRAFA